jgi:hypothetical protein
MQIIKLHIVSVMIALVAFVYSEMLTEPGMILNWIYKLLDKHLPTFLFKPLIGCFKCVGGQLSFWAFLVLFSNQYRHVPLGVDVFKLVFIHIYFVCLTIFFTEIICKIHRLIKN